MQRPGPAAVLDPASAPWTASHRRDFVAIHALGLALLALSIALANSGDSIKAQVTWINLAVISVLVLAAGDVVWLVRGRLAVAARARNLMSNFPLELPEDSLEPLATDVRFEASDWVRVDRGTRLHRAGCPLTLGKSVYVVAAESADTSAPVCEVCGR